MLNRRKRIAGEYIGHTSSYAQRTGQKLNTPCVQLITPRVLCSSGFALMSPGLGHSLDLTTLGLSGPSIIELFDQRSIIRPFAKAHEKGLGLIGNWATNGVLWILSFGYFVFSPWALVIDQIRLGLK